MFYDKNSYNFSYKRKILSLSVELVRQQLRKLIKFCNMIDVGGGEKGEHWISVHENSVLFLVLKHCTLRFI